MAAAEGEGGDSKFLIQTGPRGDVAYPLKVIYCGVCSLPPEYCEFNPNYEKCKEWMQKHLPEEMSNLLLPKDGEGGDEDGDDKKKRQTRGGRGKVKAKKQTEPQRICLSLVPRGKKKYVTVITGLASYDIDLKKASKLFAGKFSCGSSVTGDDEIVIQGDFKDDLFDLIPDNFPQIDEDSLHDLGEQKR